jgi:hypothetical protein
MSIPEGIQTVTVTGSESAGGVRSTGHVDFIRSSRTLFVGEKEILLPAKYTAPYVNGAFSIELPPNDDPLGNPIGSTYRVEERTKGGAEPYNIAVLLSNGSVQDLSALAPVDTSPGTPVVVGPRGPRGYDIVLVDHDDGSVTLTIDDPLALVDNGDGTATLELVA